MRLSLRLHPDSLASSAQSVEVEVDRPQAKALVLRYIVIGDIDGLKIPPKAAPERRDGLWQHSCFEAFVGAETADAYYELNLAPSTQWAAYRFDRYREGMKTAVEVATPDIETRERSGSLEVTARIDLAGAADLPSDALWCLALSAVLEEKSGRRCYWALAHPAGQADFHHKDCFALKLPAATRP